MSVTLRRSRRDEQVELARPGNGMNGVLSGAHGAQLLTSSRASDFPLLAHDGCSPASIMQWDHTCGKLPARHNSNMPPCKWQSRSARTSVILTYSVAPVRTSAKLPKYRNLLGEVLAIHAYALDIADRIASRKPQKYTTTAGLSQCIGKLFIDHLRNGRGFTALGAYSPRARAGLPVAAHMGKD